ncbi:MAG: DUF4336 domain-containing protein [bacterium]|nr:DUF4336 domain-containing protein [bacterium]
MTSLLDRVLQLVQPTPVDGFAPPPRALADGLWVFDRRLAMPGGPLLPLTGTLIRLPGGGLLVHSPVRLDAATAEAVRSLGPITDVLAPNGFHHLFAPAWHAAYPQARLFAAPGLPARVPALAGAAPLRDGDPSPWPDVDILVYGPVGNLGEVVVFHRPTGTLVLTDLAFNVVRVDSLFDRFGWRVVMGVPPHLAPSRTARMTLLRDRARVRPFVERLLALDVRRIVVSHGDVVEHDAAAALRRGFADYLT